MSESKISFGLKQQGHIEIIETTLHRLGPGMEYSKAAWEIIGVAIGWEPFTAALAYFKLANGSSLTDPIKIMIRTDILDSYGGAGNPHRPMSMRSMKLLNLCTKHKIKWEDKDRPPYDRCWLTLTTVNQKIALIQFLGLDVIEKLSIANQNNE